MVDIFSRLVGLGLSINEGQNWKRKRTILNKIFNFDFVKSQVFKINEVCSDAINNYKAQEDK